MDAALAKLPSDVSADCVAMLRRIFSIPPAARPTLADIMAVRGAGGGRGCWSRGGGAAVVETCEASAQQCAAVLRAAFD